MNAGHPVPTLPQRLSVASADIATALAEIDTMRARLGAVESMLLAHLVVPGAQIFPRVWVDRLAELVAHEWGIEARALRSSFRDQRFTRPRFVWVWLVKQVGRQSYPQTAALCSYGDHTGAMHACRRVEGWRQTQPEFRIVTDQLLEIGHALRGHAPAVADVQSDGRPEAGE